MSDRTAAALAAIDALQAHLRSGPHAADGSVLMDETDALRRAVAAFHMEAIRFRMYSVDRLLEGHDDGTARRLFDELRHALEAAGFHTRSHSAP